MYIYIYSYYIKVTRLKSDDMIIPIQNLPTSWRCNDNNNRRTIA